MKLLQKPRQRSQGAETRSWTEDREEGNRIKRCVGGVVVLTCSSSAWEAEVGGL
jgi:hypothetical protein